MKAILEVDGESFEVALAKARTGGWTVTVEGEAFPVVLERNGDSFLARVEGTSFHVQLQRGAATIEGRLVPYRILSVTGVGSSDGGASAGPLPVRPPMNGKLERVLVAPGQEVAKGDVLFVLEAMKMLNEVRSPMAGRVAAVHLAAGTTVEPRQIVLVLAPL